GGRNGGGGPHRGRVRGPGEEHARGPGRGCRARGPAEDPRAGGKEPALADAGIRPVGARRGGRRHLRRRPSQHGHRQGHRDVFDVRAPHAAFLRQGARGLHPQRQDRGVEQAAARGGGVRPPAAGAGAADGADCARADGRAGAAGGGRGDRGRAPVHDDARRGEAELAHHHQRHEGRVPERPGRARGVPAAGEGQGL
ncbi:MAG: GTP cyclohydrolase I type 1, partial [uncultured Gemmatimonadetes bacterium]